jgi:hypothetical protein
VFVAPPELVPPVELTPPELVPAVVPVLEDAPAVADPVEVPLDPVDTGPRKHPPQLSAARSAALRRDSIGASISMTPTA